MTNKQKQQAIFCLGQIQGIKLAIETIQTADLKNITQALQYVYECLYECLGLGEEEK